MSLRLLRGGMTTPRCGGCTKCYAAGVMQAYQDALLCPRCMKHPERAYHEWQRRRAAKKYGREGHEQQNQETA